MFPTTDAMLRHSLTARVLNAAGAFKARSLTTASACAIAVGSLMSAPAMAQQAAASGDLEEVVVTGTRIVRDGYEAPTPLTVITADALAAQSATANLADSLITNPVFALSAMPSTAVAGVSAGSQGLATLNLRGMGGNRTLTLLDGQRSVPSLFSGQVDINNFPQQLIQRVDVVTGGGSAVYGSDAVAGVVNVILDKKFTGVKGEVSGGLTTYGDDKNYKVSVAGGFGFANDRGHVLLSGEMADRDGVSLGDGGRRWNYDGWGIMVNPNYTAANGQPEYLVRPQISLSNATHGGIIISGPLKGIAFGDGGVPYRFNYGPITNDPWMQGGDWRSTEIRHDRSGTLEPEQLRHNFFGRVSYALADAVEVYGQMSWGDNIVNTPTWPPFQAGNGPTILSGNPFIPASVQAQMTSLGLTSFRIGSMNYDQPTLINIAERTTWRYVAGANGTFTAADSEWNWDTYFQRGMTISTTDAVGVQNTTRYARAVDAVRAPNGEIVCRVKLTDPSNRCVPFNPLGTNVNDAAAVEYITGTAHVRQRLTQDVFAGSITGEPFSTWAGPVSIALSAEHRSEKANAIPDSEAGTWFAGNFQAFNAKVSVTEGAFETVVPLAKDESWAEQFDLSGAVRATDYSSSGYVTTWKVGGVWAPVSDFRLRSTISRDIRAPNFLELFASNNSGFRSAFDPFTNTIPQFFGRNQGNPNLTPEKANTFELGAVLQPSFMPGFSASVDYWRIKLKDAIGSANDNQILQFCFQGRTSFCGNIVRDASGVISELIQSPFNLASQEREGIDVDVSYRTAAEAIVGGLPGDVSLRANFTKYLTSLEDSGLGDPPINNLGHGGQLLNGPPRWRLNATLGWNDEQWSASLAARAQSKLVHDNRYIECLSACPASSAAARTIENNRLPGFVYFDASFSYDFFADDRTVEAFLNVRNVLDKDPGIVPEGPTDFTYVYPLSRAASGYDLLGRIIRVGIRFQM